MTTLLNQAAAIALALTDRMQTITVAGGFITDIGTTVMRGRRRIDDNQVPCVVIIEGADRANQSPGRIPISEITQTYIFAAYHKCDPLHPNDMAHNMIRDIKRAIFSDGVTLGGQIKRVEYKGRDIGPRADGVDIVNATVEISVTYAEDLTNP